MNVPINFFDILLVALLIVGILRGRKRGLSEELMTLLLWVSMVIVCAVTYKPVGLWMESVSPMSRLFCFVASYITIAIIYSSLFIFVKKRLGGKLIGSDVFGKGEYYLGMPAGMFRFACISLFALALLNARQYTDQEIAAARTYTQDVYGSDFFPDLHEAQTLVFEDSLTGPPIKKYASFLLIEPTIYKEARIKRAAEPTLP